MGVINPLEILQSDWSRWNSTGRTKLWIGLGPVLLLSRRAATPVYYGMCLCVCVPSWQLLESSLINEIDNSLWSSALVLYITQPALDLIRMTKNLFFIGKVTVILINEHHTMNMPFYFFTMMQ